jgi:hypothetical protein
MLNEGAERPGRESTEGKNGRSYNSTSRTSSQVESGTFAPSACMRIDLGVLAQS